MMKIILLTLIALSIAMSLSEVVEKFNDKFSMEVTPERYRRSVQSRSEEFDLDDQDEDDEEIYEVIRDKDVELEVNQWDYEGKKNNTVISFQIDVLEGKGSEFVCYSGQQRSQECQIRCSLNPKECQGDKKFKKKFNCSKTSQCYCKTASFYDRVVELESGLFKNASLKPQKYKLPKNIPDYVIVNGRIMSIDEKNNNKRSVKRDVSQYNADVSLDNHVLDIVITPSTLVMVHVTKHKFKQSFEMTQSFSQALPEHLFLSSGYINVVIVKNGEIVKYIDLYVIGEKICRMKDCMMCWDAYSNFKCMPSSSKFVFVFMIIAICVMLLAFVPIVFYIGAAIFQILYCPLKFCFLVTKGILKSKMMKDISFGLKDKIKKTKEYSLVEAEEGTSKKEEELSSTSQALSNNNQKADQSAQRPRPFIVFKPRNSSALLLVAFFFAIGAHACTNGIFVPSTFNNCVRISETEETCSVVSQLTFSLQDIGASACFTIVTNNTPIATIEVKFVSERVRLITTADYITATHDGYFQSVRKCSEKSSCPEECDPYYPGKFVGSRYTPPRDDGPIDDPKVTGWPGKTTCYRSAGDGCSWNGCQECGDPCVFSSYGLYVYNPRTVTSISYQERDPKLMVIACPNGKDCQTSTISVKGTPTASVYGYVTMIGSLQGQFIDFGNKKIIVEDKTSIHLKEACAVGAPVAGAVGDIQSDSIPRMMGGGFNAFQYAEDIVTRLDSKRSTTYTFKQAGSRQLDDSSKLPVVYSGNTWSLGEDGYIGADLKTTGAVLGIYQSSEELTFTRTINQICPRFSVKNASGCYNCSSGSSVLISARSVCMPGLVIVSITEENPVLFTKSIALTNSLSDFVLQIATNQRQNKFTLTLASTIDAIEKVSLTVEFTAIEYIEIQPPNNTENSNGTKDTGGGGDFSLSNIFKDPFKAVGDFFKDMASGKLSWWLILAFVVLIVIALIVIAVIVVPIIWQTMPVIRASSVVLGQSIMAKLGKQKTL